MSALVAAAAACKRLVPARPCPAFTVLNAAAPKGRQSSRLPIAVRVANLTRTQLVSCRFATAKLSAARIRSPTAC